MSTRLTLEIASNSPASALAAQAGGADRIELFDNLAEGGTT
ncbi:copper homeostasis protein CutC, partial [Escherichia coli]